MTRKIYHVGVSGGKDSTALLLWMVKESGIPESQIRVTFNYIGNDADETIEHVRMLSRRVLSYDDIEFLYPPLDFYELARKKNRFPGAKSRFCTQELKMKPCKAYIDNLLRAGYDVVRKPGHPGSFIILTHPNDATGFDERLMEFHKAECERESTDSNAAPV